LRLEVCAYFSLSLPFQGLPGSHHTVEERIDSIGTHYDPESSLLFREPPKKSPKKAVLNRPAKMLMLMTPAESNVP
jgi:hypothetical protein